MLFNRITLILKQNVMTKAMRFFQKTSIFLVILYMTILSIVISSIFAVIGDITRENLKGVDFSKYSKTEEFVLVVFIGPLIETFIFQYLVIKGVKYLTKNIHIQCIVSAILFSSNHNFNVLYIIDTFLIGLIFGYTFLIAKIKKCYPFWATFLVHLLHNFYVFAVRHY